MSWRSWVGRGRGCELEVMGWEGRLWVALACSTYLHVPQAALEGESHKSDPVEGQHVVSHIEQARLVGGTAAAQCRDDAAGDRGPKPGLNEHQS